MRVSLNATLSTVSNAPLLIYSKCTQLGCTARFSEIFHGRACGHILVLSVSNRCPLPHKTASVHDDVREQTVSDFTRFGVRNLLDKHHVTEARLPFRRMTVSYHTTERGVPRIARTSNLRTSFRYGGMTAASSQASTVHFGDRKPKT